MRGTKNSNGETEKESKMDAGLAKIGKREFRELLTKGWIGVDQENFC
jgi:hypothetical protein